LGIAAGPILALTLITSFGMKGTLWFIVPGILMAITLFSNMAMLTTPVESAHKESKKQVKAPLARNQKISFFLLISIGTVRAWTQNGLATYIPFYYINYLKGNPLYAGKLVSTFLIAGALGILIGAPFADRWGHKKFLLATSISVFPLLLLFYQSSGLLSFAFIAAAGMVLVAPFPLTTLMAQELLPQHLGMASG